MSRLFVLLLLRWVRAEECSSKPGVERSTSSPLSRVFAPRQPRPEPVLADIIGLEEAKQVLREALILPSSMPANESRLFWRSGLRSGVLLTGPLGLGKVAAVEAAAAAAGALILPIQSTEVASSNFCRVAMETVVSERQPVVVIIESLDDAPVASLSVQQCLREAAGREDTSFRLFVVATMSHKSSTLSATMLAPFGYIVELGLPSASERMQFLLNLLKEISRVDPTWGVALNQAAVSALANLTASYSFSEIDLVVRRAFVRSSNEKGSRDPAALHEFEQIINTMPPQAYEAFNERVNVSQMVGGEPGKISSGGDKSNNKKNGQKDPMEGIFGWCNFWLPEALHLPPVVWAMIIFGILAHFMAKSTYPPSQRRKNRSRSPGFFDGGNFGGQSPFGGDHGLFNQDMSMPGGMLPSMMPPNIPGMRSPDPSYLGGSGGMDGVSGSSGSRGTEGTTGGPTGLPTAGDPAPFGPPS